MADFEKTKQFVDTFWEDEIVPTITEYISIPNVSPMFDRDWQAHGHMDRALELAKSWVEAHQPEGSTLHVGRLEELQSPELHERDVASRELHLEGVAVV